MLNVNGKELDAAVEQVWCLYDVAGQGCAESLRTLENEGMGGMWMRLYRAGVADAPIYKHEQLEAVFSEFRGLLRQKATTYIPGR